MADPGSPIPGEKTKKNLEKYLAAGIRVLINPTSEWEKRAAQAGFKVQKTYTSRQGIWYAICTS
ncbi:MAG: hypothetical protein JNM63_04705, partial [Spirochaetia bacterium]|nr:hypothetical protein [Spirochaetia bacterium]